MEPLRHIISSHGLFIPALSHHGKVMKVLHQTQIPLEREHHPGSLTFSIRYIPLSERTRLDGSFRQHVHFIAHAFMLCRGLLPQRAPAFKLRQTPSNLVTR